MSESKKFSFALGCDHAGLKYKEAIKIDLLAAGHEVKDFGTFSEESVDYPDFVRPAAEAVGRGLADLGVVLGGSGNGEAMAANKVKGIRCALCWSEETARLAKQHNDANMLSLGERQITEELAVKIVREWINATFEGGRHARRISMIEKTTSHQ
jgi:ribose 5-phosphate isomerase B